MLKAIKKRTLFEPKMISDLYLHVIYQYDLIECNMSNRQIMITPRNISS
jgi:hypothetical protein